MNCGHARLLIGGNPGSVPPELEAHLRTCPACSDFQREMARLEGPIRLALEAGPLRVQAPPARVSSARRWALAASLVLALSGGFAIWGARPGDALAREIAAHVDDEPASWSRRDRIPRSALGFVLRSSGVSIDETAGDVVYARTCPFRGQNVPHLVVMTARGPVTVLVLTGEAVASVRRIDEEGYSGMLLPSAGGAIAILAQGDTDVQEVAYRVQRAIRWTAPAASR